jgi:NAD+ kinase
MRNFVLTPIAPHLTPLRSIVAAEGSVVELVVASHQGAVLTIDGQEDLGLRHGDSVEVRTAEQTTVFARRGSRSRFYDTLRSKINRGA